MRETFATLPKNNNKCQFQNFKVLSCGCMDLKMTSVKTNSTVDVHSFMLVNKFGRQLVHVNNFWQPSALKQVIKLPS